MLDGPGLPESWQGPRDRRQRGGGRLFRAEGTCRTPSPLPASLGCFFPLAGRGCREVGPVPGSRGSVAVLAGSPSLLVQKPGTCGGLDPAKIARSGWGREKGGWRRATKDRGGLGPPKTICCRAPRHAQDVLAYCPYRDQALRDALSGTERVAWGHPVAPASTWDGRPDRSERQL
jgi:hypothetical protein